LANEVVIEFTSVGIGLISCSESAVIVMVDDGVCEGDSVDAIISTHRYTKCVA